MYLKKIVKKKTEKKETENKERKVKRLRNIFEKETSSQETPTQKRKSQITLKNEEWNILVKKQKETKESKFTTSREVKKVKEIKIRKKVISEKDQKQDRSKEWGGGGTLETKLGLEQELGCNNLEKKKETVRGRIKMIENDVQRGKKRPAESIDTNEYLGGCSKGTKTTRLQENLIPILVRGRNDCFEDHDKSVSSWMLKKIDSKRD